MPDMPCTTHQTPPVSPHNRARETQSASPSLEGGSDMLQGFANIILGMD